MAQFADNLINQITATRSISAVHSVFKTFIKEGHENVFTAMLSNGQDPVVYLSQDVANHTLGLLFLLSSRIHAHNTAPLPPWQVVSQFCAQFSPEQARLVPERVTKLAKGIQRYAQQSGNPALAVTPLQHLIQRYPPDLSYLTTIHSIFLMTCVTTRNFTPALPILAVPITNIDLSLSPDLTYQDNLIYHYTGGIALAALKKWSEAEEYFEICVTSPGNHPAALQFEALKKLRLVQIISKGEVGQLPKYTSSHLIRLFRNSVYAQFLKHYPQNQTALRELVAKEKAVFASEKNLGLINQAIARAPRWVLKKLTATYVTLHLSDIAKRVGIESEDEVRGMLLSMIESGELTAHISSSNTVTFTDPPPSFTKAEVDDVLRKAQDQARLMSLLDAEVGRSKEFLNKVSKGHDNWGPSGPGGIGMGMDEDVYQPASMGWADETMFS
ncbi:hypothetical protein CVT24_002608 [Panaeolus cyanescens]|uniref:COP9 signalosome complex subunit 3 n=1 Tax=Panaeolus cyanescens TaxID=181874 RepID=A0A409YTX4_9AGAR|nr:hypothetical protein CVT24_002608 [Panaeolus cyanescens]